MRSLNDALVELLVRCDFWRSGTTRAANGAAGLPIVVVGRIDIAGAVEVEVVGVGAVRVRSRRPVVAVVAGILEQIAGTLPDVAAPNGNTIGHKVTRSYFSFWRS